MEDINPIIIHHAAGLLSGLGRAEVLRTESYQNAINLQSAKLGSLRRERERLVNKYGPTHTKVKQLDRQMSQASHMMGALGIQQVRANNPVVPATSGSWLLQGMLISRQGIPASGITVSLFDGSGVWVRELGYHCTGSDGIFKLLVTDSEAIDELQTVPVFVTLTNSIQEVLLQDTRPLTVADGLTVVRNLVLDDNICPPPVRRVVVTDGPPGTTPTPPRT